MLPLILIPLIIGGAAMGAGMAADGMSKMAKIRGRKEKADAALAGAQEDFTALVKRLIAVTRYHESWVVSQVRSRLETLEAAARLSVQTQRIDSVKFGRKEALSESFAINKVFADAARGALSGLAGGLVTGVAAEAAITGLVAEFGVASTGTAIASLSGAAATSATTAAIGGGSLAAGGGGMALGGAILGGVVAAPVLFAMGLKILTAGDKAETQAEKYCAEVTKAVAQIKAHGRILDEAVRSRVEELRRIARIQFEAFDKVVGDLRDHPQAGSAGSGQQALRQALANMIQSAVVVKIRSEKKHDQIVEDVQTEAVVAPGVLKAVRTLSHQGRTSA